MTDVMEMLADTNPVIEGDLAPSFDDLWRELDIAALPQDRTRLRFARAITSGRRRRVRRLVTVGAGVVAAAVAVSNLGTTGGGPPNAFAGGVPPRPRR